MKKLKYILISILLFTITLHGDEKTNLKNNFNTKLTIIISIVEDKTINKEKRNQDIIEQLQNMFDFELMARLSLGKTAWNQLNSKQREEFTKLYVKRMENSYSSKLDSYNKDQKIEVTEVLQPKSNRIELVTQIVNGTESFDVKYKFYKPKHQKPNKESWLIYDVEILGVSILKTDKVQFKEFLQSKSIYELMEKMK